MLSSRVGRRWIFRANSGWLGGHRHEDMLALVVCGALVLGGITMALSGAWEAYRVARSYFWPTVVGHVVSIKIEDRGGASADRFQPHVAYSYRVGGRTYLSTQLRLSGPVEVGDDGDAAAYLQRYIPGAPITVYYHPLRPADSVTEHTLNEPTIRGLSFGLGACMIGVTLLLMFDLLRR
jgi:hypothetical protein